MKGSTRAKTPQTESNQTNILKHESLVCPRINTSSQTVSKMKRLILLLVLISIISIQAMKLPKVLQILKSLTGDCEGTQCPAGCCPYVGWACCPDNLSCAETMADCD